MTLKSTEHNAYIPPGLTHPPRDDTFDDLKRNESKVYFYSTELPLIQFYTQKLKISLLKTFYNRSGNSTRIILRSKFFFYHFKRHYRTRIFSRWRCIESNLSLKVVWKCLSWRSGQRKDALQNTSKVRSWFCFRLSWPKRLSSLWKNFSKKTHGPKI